MYNKELFEKILQKEGAVDAIKEISYSYNIHNRNQISKEWNEIEELLLNFSLKRLSLGNQLQLEENIIRPFPNSAAIEELKKCLLN